jgi:hypothetical protein
LLSVFAFAIAGEVDEVVSRIHGALHCVDE